MATPGKIGVVRAFTTKILGTFIGLLLNILLARLLGPSGIGIYFLAQTVTSIGTIMARFGIDLAVLRFASVAYDQNDQPKLAALYRNSMTLVFLVGLAVTIAIYILTPYLPLGGHENKNFNDVLKIMLIAIIPLSLLRLQGQFFKAIKAPGKGIFTQAVIMPLFLVFGILIYQWQFNIHISNVAYIYIVASIMALMFSIYLWNCSLPRLWRMHGHFDNLILIRASFPLFWLAGMNVMMNWTDMLILGAWTEPATVGMYGISLRIAALIGFVLIAVNSVVSPKFAAIYSKGNHEALEHLAQKSTKLMLIIVSPILLFIWIFPELILNLFGKDFGEDVWLLRILALGQFVNVAIGAVGALLLMTGNERIIRNNVFFAIAINVAGNLVLVPIYGGLGAAISTSFSLIFQNILLYLAVRKILKIKMLYL